MKQKYNTQKAGAKVRNIEWHFTYESWLAWWGDDIVNRGNKSGQLVMARKNDNGPYHPDNVEKITCNQNHSDAHKNGKGGGVVFTDAVREKMSAALKGRVFSAEHRAKLNVTKKGVPRSPEVKEKIRATLLAKRKKEYDPS